MDKEKILEILIDVNNNDSGFYIVVSKNLWHSVCNEVMLMPNMHWRNRIQWDCLAEDKFHISLTTHKKYDYLNPFDINHLQKIIKKYKKISNFT